jgi:alpha-L-fucosidase 2
MRPFSSILCGAIVLLAAAVRVGAATDASLYNVPWDTLGKDYRDSMPIGNGDIGLNVWTEQNGDLVFLIGKTDAYTENGQLVKLGRIRVKLTPNPFTTPAAFSQVLNVGQGEVDIQGQTSGGRPTTLRIWVDANHPVVHIEGSAAAPTTVQASVELWRTAPRPVVQGSVELWGQGVFRELNNTPMPLIVDPDTVLSAQNNHLAWCHFNSRSTYPEVFQNQHLATLLAKYPDPLLHRTFGVEMKGAGFISDGDLALKSAKPQTSFRLDLYALTQKADSPQQWRTALEQTVAKADATPLETARKAHRRWWVDFWNRSWINVTGTPDADKVSQSYAMQRWMDACGGRGAIPIKYNGSIFTVGQEEAPEQYDPAKGAINADFRAWGGNFWAQNQRQVYWPMIAAGDYDTLAPYFGMYRNALPLEIDRTKLYWGHAGASYPETMYFWGTPNNNDFGWGNKSNVMQNTWIRNHVTGGLETVAMMLGEYDNTQDAAFARQTMLPVAVAVTTYFDRHWPRGADGKIHMDPSQAIETYQQAVNPTTDIAGLMNVLPRLLALPAMLTTSGQRAMWTKMRTDLPPIPLGKTGMDGKMPKYGQDSLTGTPTILPAAKYSDSANVENPELYTVFPFRIYGVGFPDLDLARNTYAARVFKSSTCWGQDGEDVALLGMTDDAQSEVVANFTAYGGERYKWFWKQGHDWEPDMDNGGAGQSILQLMLMQCDGKRIQLLPAWPADWNGDFKLHAPYQTTVQATVRGGKITALTVTPAARRKDVVIVSQDAK